MLLLECSALLMAEVCESWVWEVLLGETQVVVALSVADAVDGGGHRGCYRVVEAERSGGDQDELR